MYTLCGHLEVVLLARHNWTGKKGSTMKAFHLNSKVRPSFPFHLILNPNTSLILKEHTEMHATNSVSERSGEGGGANFHAMQELSVRVSWLCHAEATFFFCERRNILLKLLAISWL